MSAMLALLAAVTDDRAIRSTSYRAVHDLVGQGTLSRRLIDALELLSGYPEVRCTTLARLRPAIGHGFGLVANAFRVCPACMAPASGVEYGMLAHQLLNVVRCPLHGCPLLEHCQRCGRRIALLTNPFLTRACRGCNTPYASSKSFTAQGDVLAHWKQAQMLELVAFGSGPKADLPAANWLEQYAEALTGLVARPEAYSLKERKDLRELVKRIRRSPGSAPSIASLLRVATIQSVGIVDLVRFPIQACSPRLLDAGDVRGMVRTRRQRLRTHWLKGRDLVEELLRSDASQQLPPKTTVLRDLALGRSGFWQHFPELANRYQNERLRRREAEAERTRVKAVAAAKRLVRTRASRGEQIGVRADGAGLRLELGAPKAMVEDALSAALAEETRRPMASLRDDVGPV